MLDVTSGELTALHGPSGCGKPTAKRMVAGLIVPASGDITFHERSILRDKPVDRGAVMVFQNHLQFPSMSVAENLGLGLRMRKVPTDQIATWVAATLARVKLPDLCCCRPTELSGGQQQGVAPVRALIARP